MLIGDTGSVHATGGVDPGEEIIRAREVFRQLDVTGDVHLLTGQQVAGRQHVVAVTGETLLPN